MTLSRNSERRRCRLLVLSDLHIGVPGTIRRFSGFSRPILREVARFAHGWGGQIDGILIGGDLADSGWRRDLDEASRLLVTPPGPSPKPWINRRQPTLMAARSPIGLVPGNHDRFDRPVFAFPGNTTLDTHPDIPWSGSIQCSFFPSQQEPVLAVVAADFSLASRDDAQGVLGHWGQGKVYADRLDSLLTETRRLRSEKPETAVLWMLHFAPAFANLSPGLKLIDETRVLGACGNERIDHLVCGHTHQARAYKVTGHPEVAVHCAGSAACLVRNREPSIHVLDVRIASGRVSRLFQSDFAWDRQKKTFLPKIP